MAVLLLTEKEVQELLTMEMALEGVTEVLRHQGLDEAQNVPRSRCQAEQTMLHVLSGASKKQNILGYKAYSTSRKGAEFHIGLYDSKSGGLEALVQADYLGQMRTGAASGVATQYMARPDAQDVGIFGSGKQARTQLWAVSKVRKIRKAQVFSPREESRRKFAADMTQLCQCDVEPVSRAELAARDKDIVITATSSREPVLNGSWLADGTHLNVIGSNFLAKAEVDVATFRRCKSVIVDSKDQARLEAGDFVQALEEGVLQWSSIHELGQVVVGRYPGRAHPQDITIFKSLGIALEDIAVAAKVVEKAKSKGIGRWLDW